MLRRLAVFFLLLAFAGATAAQSAEAPRDYRLGAGDEISVLVFGEPDLSLTAKIGDNGRIAYPFLGELSVAGASLAELERTLAERLAGDYLVDPKVTVSVVQYRPFFVNGQVRSPGSYPWQPGMSVRKAISLAGGLTERASERKITLIAEGRKGQGKGRPVKLDDALGPGDILTIDESFF
jgi:polysaccharide biosynthesis/export protein VpsN